MRFQIHLSTAVVLMLAASALMWANFLERQIVAKSILGPIEVESKLAPIRPIFSIYGWPFTAAESQIGFIDHPIIGTEGAPLQSMHYRIPKPMRIHQEVVATNVAFAVAILGMIWFALEFRIQRR